MIQSYTSREKQLKLFEIKNRMDLNNFKSN